MKNENADFKLSDRVSLGVIWGSRVATLGQYIEQVGAFLKALQAVHPVFRELYEIGNKPGAVAAIEPDMGNLQVLLHERVYNKYGRYSEVGPDKKRPTLNATNDIGFSSNFINQPKEGVKGVTTRLGVSVSSGNFNSVVPNSASIELPHEGYPEFYEYDFQKELFRILIDYWSPVYGLTSQYSFNQKVAPDKDDNMYIGALTYFSDPRVKAALPEDIEQEPFCLNGVLVVASRERPSGENASLVNNAKRIRDALHPKGLLRYSIEILSPVG